VKVLTGPFGEQKLVLADLVVAKSLIAGATTEDEGELISFPPNGMMLPFQGQIGKVYRVQMTGVQNGVIYGTNTYTLDSYIAAAAVHSGVLKIGETAIVRIKIVPGLNSYASSSQNGILSNAYGNYPPGAYEILGKSTPGGAVKAMPALPVVRPGVIIRGAIAPPAIIR
jgi:hypothetical protein